MNHQDTKTRSPEHRNTKPFHLLILLVTLCLGGSSFGAGFRIYQTITLTNSANLTNGIQFTLNGDVRTGEDIVTNASTQFARSNRVDYAMTNLYAHLAAHPFAGVTFGASTATNNIVLIGNTNVVMAGSFFGAWGNVTNVTNAVYGASPVVVPFGGESNAYKNFLMSALLTEFQSWVTNKFSNNAPAFVDFLTTRTNAQAFTNKSFFGGTNASNVLVQTRVASGTIASGLTFDVGATLMGDSLTINSDSELYFFNPAPLNDTPKTVARLNDITNRTYQFGAQFSINSGTTPRTINLTNVLELDWLDIPSGDLYTPVVGSEDGTEVYATFSLAEGKDSTTIVRFGDFSAQFQFDGTNISLVLITNTPRMRFSGPVTYDVGTYASLTGAGSNNVVQLATNAWTLLSGNVSACNVNSLRFADGLPAGGRRAGIINGSLFPITLIDSSSDGFETQDTNRMLLGNSGNIVLLPRTAAEFIYDTSSSRWQAISPTPLFATATNVVLSTVNESAGGTNATHFPIDQTNTTAGVLQLRSLSPGANVTITDQNTNLQITASFTVWSNGVVVAVTTNINFIDGTNIVTRFTNTAGRIDFQINAVGGGEANVNGEVSVTNATKMGLVYDKVGASNRLRSVQGGNGIIKTNEGTNIVTAIDPAVVGTVTGIAAAVQASTNYADHITNATPVITASNVNVAVARSNAAVGGTLYRAVIIPAFTNLNTTLATVTNGSQFIVDGHTLTNNGDSLTITFKGTSSSGTNAFNFVYGYETVLTIASLTNNSGSWEAQMEITRTGNTSANADAWFRAVVGSAGNANTAVFISTNKTLACTNGTAITNVVQLASNKAGGASNHWHEVVFKPASR